MLKLLSFKLVSVKKTTAKKKKSCIQFAHLLHSVSEYFLQSDNKFQVFQFN